MERTWFSSIRANRRAKTEQKRIRNHLEGLIAPGSHARTWLLDYMDNSPNPTVCGHGIRILLEDGAAPEAIVEAVETHGYHVGTKKIRMAQIKNND